MDLALTADDRRRVSLGQLNTLQRDGAEGRNKMTDANPSGEEIEQQILDQILDQLLGLTARAGELVAKVERIEDRLEEQGRSLLTIRDMQAGLNSRLESHGEAIGRLEVEQRRLGENASRHRTWRSRVGGISLGVTATIAAIAALMALLRSLL